MMNQHCCKHSDGSKAHFAVAQTALIASVDASAAAALISEPCSSSRCTSNPSPSSCETSCEADARHLSQLLGECLTDSSASSSHGIIYGFHMHSNLLNAAELFPEGASKVARVGCSQ